ncbi:MAG: hypothetical protein BLM47_06560 [Candidatus Reconcilbacillus cellulovorans]|uniref:Uncharacterized protein n=1 Tax=Candidatus Reconcilbacillus cellulovorans TaxID=1906605 RepID=A0A2A6E0H7_9BACL|nr:MAG: hypothetical protein BLM47_06560 [Candidatus Reconcilbacillus cellulovorans]
MPKHSGLGIASFVLGIAAFIIGVAGMVVFIGAIAAQMPNIATGGPEDTAQFIEKFTSENPAIIATFGICFLLSVLLILIGLVLGISALFQQDRKKGFAIAGVAVNGSFLALFILLTVIGLLSGAGAPA